MCVVLKHTYLMPLKWQNTFQAFNRIDSMTSRQYLALAFSTFLLTTMIGVDYADARSRHHRRHHHRHHHHHHRDAGRIAAGIIIGGAIAGAVANSVESDRENYGSYSERRDRHVAWCSRQFRSYSPSSDTYVSTSGRALRCNSPYD